MALPADVRTATCVSGHDASQRKATFTGSMEDVPGARKMSMRFSLVRLRSGGGGYVDVDAPGLAAWHTSRSGVRRFVFRQGVEALRAGGTYRALVSYRWLDGQGRAVRSTRRRSAFCRQRGPVPNLRVTGITTTPGPAEGTLDYFVTVVNDGEGPSDSFRVGLSVDGATLDSLEVASLARGSLVRVGFTGPACRAAVAALVDRNDDVPEGTEDDNTVSQGCPPA